MKKSTRIILNLFVYALTIAVFCVLAGGYWIIHEYKRPGPLQESVRIDIPLGLGVTGIANELERQGIIRNATVFQIGQKFIDNRTFLKAGEYELEPNLSMQDVVYALQSGRVIQRQVTIPECVTSYEVMNVLNEVDGLEGHIHMPPQEGSVFPNTYFYIKGEDRQTVLERMQSEMDLILETAWRLHGQNNPQLTTPQEVMILASIVEKETGKVDERPKVAGLFLNRLRQGMRLQSDPTVIYGIVRGRPETGGEGPLGRRITRRDLEFDSPYNTYLYAGLPPTPICNPGKASIEAVLNPERHSYIYMVADGTGGHAFAETLREHNANVAKWRTIRDAPKPPAAATEAE